MTRGSPPHTRGIHSCTSACLPFTGFTPAYAGNTLSGHVHPYALWVHPRIRGEYLCLMRYSHEREGSPPHTRGIPPACRLRHGFRRFTPAYAGNTRCPGVSLPESGVHPRIRGEYRMSAARMISTRGSPPHTRGILVMCIPFSSILWFTPAYAGNTFQRPAPCSSSWVHPRIRGEYQVLQRQVLFWQGSPPHTRGIRSASVST